MKKSKRSSRTVSPGRFFRTIRDFSDRMIEDRVTVYSAQASFFTVISVVPFLMLFLSLARLIFPEVVDGVFTAIENELPEKFSTLLSTVYTEIVARGSVSIVSITALAMLWTSSRGVAAMTRGVAEVYRTREHTTFITETILSFIYTVLMIISVIAALTVLVFGASIRDLAVARFPNSAGLFDGIIRFRMVAFFILMVIVFSLIYTEVSRRGKRKGGDRSYIPTGFKAQLPGAGVAAVGWMLYSFVFSLYITYFPTASYIYGSLAAVILFMFWLYFCMIIFLVGAEINKILYENRKNRPERHKKS